MNDRLRQNLENARAELQIAQWLLSEDRKRGGDDPSAVKLLYHCLDRAWEAQCMVGGSL